VHQHLLHREYQERPRLLDQDYQEQRHRPDRESLVLLD
jgi:hypothetical protein